MPSPSFGSLARQLRDCGVAPKYAARLCQELRDHYEDLEEEALRAQRSTRAAAVEAQARLGDEQTIAAEFARHPELKIWIYRSRGLLACLRSLSWLIIATRVCGTAAYDRRHGLARFGAAAAAAAAMTTALLLALDLAISSQVHEDPERIAATVPRALPATASAPERIDSAPAIDVVVAVPPEPALPAGHPARRKPRPPDGPAEAPGRLYVADAEPVRIQISVTAPAPIGALRAGIEFTGATLADGEYLPIVKVAPVFPQRAASRGLEGYVVLEYTITPSGNVQNVVVVESTDDVFEQSAVHAVSRFKYKPRIVQGRPVHVHGVRAKVNFKIEA